jgi:hypothetical protein
MPDSQSYRPLDAAGVMDTMHESHTGQLLPRLEAGDAVLAQFAEHCLDCKVSKPGRNIMVCLHHTI